MVGGILFGFLGHLTIKWGRHPVVILGSVLSLLSYTLMFVNFPMDANNDAETDEIGFLDPPNKALAITTSFLLGFSDSCFATQVTNIFREKNIPTLSTLKVSSILGGFFKDQAASAFGIFKFVQSLASAINFFYSPYLGFHYQLLILAIFNVVGTLAFVRLELISRRIKLQS